MEGKEAIIKKIIEDANLKATAIIDNAESQRTALIDEAKAWANEYERVQLEEMNKDAGKKQAKYTKSTKIINCGMGGKG